MQLVACLIHLLLLTHTSRSFFTGIMRSACFLVAAAVAVGCTSEPLPTPDMIEVRPTASVPERMEIGATALKNLADDGMPDLSCAFDAATEERCSSAISPHELLVRVVYNESMTRVFVQCDVSDDSEHPGLLEICLNRVREELSRAE